MFKSIVQRSMFAVTLLFAHAAGAHPGPVGHTHGASDWIAAAWSVIYSYSSRVNSLCTSNATETKAWMLPPYR